VERTLNAYLLGRLLDATQTSARLTEHDAERIAYEELRSSRHNAPLRDPRRHRSRRLDQGAASRADATARNQLFGADESLDATRGRVLQ
jgi:hypothetical protein